MNLPEQEDKDLLYLADEDAGDDDLHERYRFSVDRGQSPLRIDKFLTAKVQNASRNKVQAAAKAGNILVNGTVVKSNYKVRPLDEIAVLIAGEPRITDVLPEDIPLDIVFEDEHIIVINKAAGMVVHPGYNNYTGTLVNALAFHLNQGGAVANTPFLVHRIDKDTTGLLVVAKNETAQAYLGRQFFDHTSERTYVALVWGEPEVEGTITGHIGRGIKDRKIMGVFPDGSQGKHAVTHYRIIEKFGYTTLIECRLETGRTHQIRAHFKYIGHPLFNDEKYGGERILKGTTHSKYKQFIDNCFSVLPRQALHARDLAFDHPGSGKRVSFSSPMPDDMAQALEKWRRYTKNRIPEE